MEQERRTLIMEFNGDERDRTAFLRAIRAQVTKFTTETMTLDALIHEIAKNIFDHAHGRGSLKIERVNGTFQFEIRDGGQESYDFETCATRSQLAGNGINFGVGLQMIRSIARDLSIDLKVDASRGFHYWGTYKPITR